MINENAVLNFIFTTLGHFTYTIKLRMDATIVHFFWLFGTVEVRVGGESSLRELVSKIY